MINQSQDVSRSDHTQKSALLRSLNENSDRRNTRIEWRRGNREKGELTLESGEGSGAKEEQWIAKRKARV